MLFIFFANVVTKNNFLFTSSIDLFIILIGIQV